MKRFLILLALLMIPSSFAAAEDGWTKEKEEDGITVYSEKIKGQDLLIVKKMSLSKLPSAELLKEGVLIGLFNMRLDNFNGFFDELPNSRGYIYSDE